MEFKTSLYKCPECGSTGDQYHWVHDSMEGLICGDCGVSVKFAIEREADWVSVAAYDTAQRYGGPEEGGWYYTTGTRIDETLRNFVKEDFDQVEAYIKMLEERYGDYGEGVTICTRTDGMIYAGFPANRPYYC